MSNAEGILPANLCVEKHDYIPSTQNHLFSLNTKIQRITAALIEHFAG
jgi:hypothetical protein